MNSGTVFAGTDGFTSMGPTGICQLDRFENRVGVIVLGLVDPCRNRPHAHQFSREGSHQVTRVWLLARAVLCFEVFSWHRGVSCNG
jgi:hypothetical protein